MPKRKKNTVKKSKTTTKKKEKIEIEEKPIEVELTDNIAVDFDVEEEITRFCIRGPRATLVLQKIDYKNPSIWRVFIYVKCCRFPPSRE